MLTVVLLAAGLLTGCQPELTESEARALAADHVSRAFIHFATIGLGGHSPERNAYLVEHGLLERVERAGGRMDLQPTEAARGAVSDDGRFLKFASGRLVDFRLLGRDRNLKEVNRNGVVYLELVDLAEWTKTDQAAELFPAVRQAREIPKWQYELTFLYKEGRWWVFRDWVAQQAR